MGILRRWGTAAALALLLTAGGGCPADDDDADDDDAADDDGADDDGADDDTADDDSGDDDGAEGPVGRVAVLEIHTLGETPVDEGSVVVWGPLDEPWENGWLGDWNFGCSEGEGDKGVWRVTQTSADCVLAILQACGQGCDPDCPPDEYCTSGGECVPTPSFAESGTITIDGLTQPVSLEPSAWGYPPPWDLPADLFAAGDPVTLGSAGGATPALSAAVAGAEPLVAALPCDDPPPTDQDLVITWTPGTSPSARIRWEMTQDVHLFQGPRIRCETDDDGELTVPAAMIAAYMNGMKHFLTLTRVEGEVAEVGGGNVVAFEVGSRVTCVINENHTPW